jgi:hypothetical protein
VLRRSLDAARRLNPEATIRLESSAGEIEAGLAEGPQPGDAPLHLGDVVAYAAAGLEGVLDVEPPHDRLILKPPGSRANPRPEA